MGEIRISGGREKGRKLKTLKGSATRPTSGRVKEALFNILGPRIRNARFLEPFGGSGAVSFEAISRGAEKAAIFEMARDASRVIEENLALLGYQNNIRLLQGDFSKGLAILEKEGSSFDLVFLDPPYGGKLALECLQALVKKGIVCLDGWIVLEHRSNEDFPEAVEEWRKTKTYRYGETSLSIYAFTRGTVESGE